MLRRCKKRLYIALNSTFCLGGKRVKKGPFSTRFSPTVGGFYVKNGLIIGIYAAQAAPPVYHGGGGLAVIYIITHLYSSVNMPNDYVVHMSIFIEHV